MTTNGFVAGATEVVAQVASNFYQAVNRPVIWAPDGGNVAAYGMVVFSQPNPGLQGVNSQITAISLNQVRNAEGIYVDTLYKLTAVGAFETQRTKLFNPERYVGGSPRAGLACAQPHPGNYNGGLRTDIYSFQDLNDLTLVKGLEGTGKVLTNAFAVNRSGYVLAQANDGKTYVLVPLTY